MAVGVVTPPLRCRRRGSDQEEKYDRAQGEGPGGLDQPSGCDQRAAIVSFFHDDLLRSLANEEGHRKARASSKEHA